MSMFTILYRKKNDPLYVERSSIGAWEPHEALQNWLYGLEERGQDYKNIEILTIFREEDY